MTAERQLRVGILGAGTIAAVHAGNLDGIPEARLVAVADIAAERAAALAAPRGAVAVATLDELLGQPIDAVLVCLPPFATAGVVARLAERGLHVYAEKPVGLDLPAALADLSAVRRSGVVAASGYMWRAAPIVAKARELLAGRATGLVHGTVITAAPSPAWWRSKRLSGGMIVELATHVIDLVRLFGGEPRRLTCIGARTLLDDAQCSVEDVAAATIAFASGAVGSLGLTCGTSGGRWSVDVVAHNLHLELDFFPERLTGNLDGQPLEYSAAPFPGTTVHGFSGSAAWYLSLQRFVRAALAGDPAGVAATFADGVRTLALTLACEHSLASAGMPVDVEKVP